MHSLKETEARKCAHYYARDSKSANPRTPTDVEWRVMYCLSRSLSLSLTPRGWLCANSRWSEAARAQWASFSQFLFFLKNTRISLSFTSQSRDIIRGKNALRDVKLLWRRWAVSCVNPRAAGGWEAAAMEHMDSKFSPKGLFKHHGLYMKGTF